MTFRWGMVGAVAFALVGCSAVGVVASSDPNVKLQQAEALYNQELRPLPAEHLILEAIEIYQKQGNKLGLAEAYRQYGFLLISPAVVKWEPVIRSETGFADKSITYDNRYDKAAEFFQKSADYYVESGREDWASNVYNALASVQYHRGKTQEACSAFDQAIAMTRRYAASNPSAKLSPPPRGYNSFDEFLLARKKAAHCPDPG